MLSTRIDEQNNRVIPEFEGYSPNEMNYILYNTFDTESPIQLTALSESDYKEMPLLNQIKFLAGIIDKKSELKLTAKGFLPTAIVSEVYSQKFLKDKFIESGTTKLYKESNSMTIRLTRILLDLTGITKKKYNKLSLTKKGHSLLSDDNKLFKQVFSTFQTRFNWAYFDSYGDNQIGQLGLGFTLILLNKYGETKQSDRFYADKYFTAFPSFLDNITSSYQSPEEQASRCYSIRTFDRFLDYFGLINKTEQKTTGIYNDKYISKTKLFDKLIKCRPHNDKIKSSIIFFKNN